MKIKTILRLADYSKFSMLFAVLFLVILFTGMANRQPQTAAGIYRQRPAI
jgi:hypothetical protein